MDWSNVGNAVKTLAPTIATALGGPLAGAAVEALTRAVGGSPDAAKSLQDAIKNNSLTGDQIVALKQADLDFQKFMADHEIKLEDVAANDRDSARKREIAVRDYIPGALAVSVTLGFFGVLFYLLDVGKPQQGGDALLVMLGSLGTAWASIIAYYFGSSSGSAAKNVLLDKLTTKV